MTELAGNVGFGAPIIEKRFSKRRNLGVELLATVALAISLVIAATAVSIGMARAQALHAAAQAPLALTWFLGAAKACKVR